jgi:hypothetical protein
MGNTFDRKKHVYRNDEFSRKTVTAAMPAQRAPKRLSPFTVIGYWPDTMQRFADEVRAVSAAEAEDRCLKKHSGVAVCCVLEGSHHPADRHDYVRPE